MPGLGLKSFRGWHNLSDFLFDGWHAHSAGHLIKITPETPAVDLSLSCDNYGEWWGGFRFGGASFFLVCD